MIHLLVPMSGQGTRYHAIGYKEPKPLIPVNGTPMIKRLVDCFPIHWPKHFVMAENHRQSDLPQYLKSKYERAHQYFVPVHKDGPGRAIEKALEAIPEDDAVFVSYCDYGMIWDAPRFEEFVYNSACDACLISYKGFHPHYLGPTKYAYSRLEGDRVVEVREKGSFTENRQNEYASAGGYFFKSAKILKRALEYQKKRNLILMGETYTSLTVQALIEDNPKANVRVFEIERFFQWGTPTDLWHFEYWEKTFSNWNNKKESNVDQILMPMAGFGSRFEEFSKLPKPLIPVFGKEMFKAALDSLPKSNHQVIVLRDIIEQKVQGNFKKVVLDSTPSGQALTVKAGLGALKGSGDIIISSCDHAIVIDNEVWTQFREQKDCDAAIFTMRGYPGASRRPQAFAYVKPKEADRSLIPQLDSVSVKVPISENPEKDHLLVGTFWFRDASILKKGLQILEERNVRVNGELYLDSIFDVLQTLGHKVRVIPLSGYICWGDPDSYLESIYWQEVFTGMKNGI